MKLSPIELLALSKLTADAQTRAAVAPGEYEGTVDVSVDYKLKVGEDYEQAQVQNVPWQKVVMVLLSKVNDTTLEAVLREALTGDLDDKQIKAQAKAAMATIMGSVMQDHKGKVNGHVVAAPSRLKGLS